jgi:hypothetical protein
MGSGKPAAYKSDEAPVPVPLPPAASEDASSLLMRLAALDTEVLRDSSDTLLWRGEIIA